MSEKYFYKGKPLRVLSTSLGIVLAANLLLTPAALGEMAGAASGGEPKLVEASTEAVKAYFDPSMDWNIPMPKEQEDKEGSTASGGSGGASGEGGSGGSSQVIVNNVGGHGGFGWGDLLLYHLIFNSGRSYSSRGWYDSRPVYDSRTNQPYKPKSFESGSFQNKPVENSTVRPKTSSSKGSFTTKSSKSPKSTSSSPGGIGSKSSGFSSSGKSSGSSFGS